jgi:hypothetical protein
MGCRAGKSKAFPAEWKKDAVNGVRRLRFLTPYGSRLTVHALRVVGAKSAGRIKFALQNTVSVGDYYIEVCSDDLKTVDESNEDNNCTMSSKSIRVFSK